MSHHREPYAAVEGEGPGLPQSTFPSFMGAPWVSCDATRLRDMGAKAAFLGVPFDQATVYRSGSSHAPRALRYVSEMFLPYLGDFDINVFKEFNLADVGDVPMIGADAARSRGYIEKYVGEILQSGGMPICIGGDHSIPIPIGIALSRHVAGKFGYVHFDAHIDCQPHFAGERFTNWSHVARMIELHNVDTRNVAIVGARGALNPPEQWDFVEEHQIRVYRMREIQERGLEVVVNEALDIVTDATDAFYCSLDSDVVDASAMPGTDAPEPGGLLAAEMLRACELIGARKPAALDIVELIPAYDHPAMISMRLAGYMSVHGLGGWATGGEQVKQRDRKEADVGHVA
jgi:agmatinase